MNTENIIPVNNEALSRALIAVVGEERAAVIVQSYREIDRAMADGYAAGYKAAQDAANAQATEAGTNAYDVGHTDGYVLGFEDGGGNDYAKGYADAETSAYDDGYIDGVSDARVSPSDADARVAELCSEDAEVDDYDDQADEDGFDGTYEREYVRGDDPYYDDYCDGK